MDKIHKSCDNYVLAQNCNKITKNWKNINNRRNILAEDIEFDNVEYEEVSVQQKIEEKNNMNKELEKEQ